MEVKWLASYPAHFTPEVRVSGTHWTGDWVGPRTGLDMMAMRIQGNMILEH